jgi:hypothetical protein
MPPALNHLPWMAPEVEVDRASEAGAPHRGKRDGVPLGAVRGYRLADKVKTPSPARFGRRPLPRGAHGTAAQCARLENKCAKKRVRPPAGFTRR